MRVIITGAIILAIIALLAVPPAGALFDVGFMGGPVNIGAPYVVYSGYPGFTYAMPFSQGSFLIQAFNSSTLAHDFTGSLAVAFPSIADGSFNHGPGAGPAIAQATSESIVATKSYFFNDFLTGA